MKPSKALRKGGKPSKKRMLGGKKKKPDGPLEKKKKGVSLNPVDRSKLRKLMSKRQGKENESLPTAVEKQPKKGADAGERKRRLSGSSVDSAASKRSKKKRVSFANQLEHTKLLDSFDDSVALEVSTSTPGRSILRRRQQLAAEEKKLLEKKRLDAETERKAAEPVDAAGDDAERPQPAPVASPPDDEPPMKIKSKPKLQVTKKMKVTRCSALIAAARDSAIAHA